MSKRTNLIVSKNITTNLSTEQDEYRKRSLADALVEMLRLLLRYDFTKRQLNLKTED